MGIAERRVQDLRTSDIKKVEKENPIQVWTTPKGSGRLRLPNF